MARWLTVLVALVAQGMALMSPLCLVRCVSPSGHECVELLGQGCRCCDCPSQKTPQVCAVATCGHHHEEEHEQQDEQDAPVGWQVRCEHCSCQHSPLELPPQVRNKSLVSDVWLASHDMLLSTETWVAVAIDSRLEFANLSLLRPQESPHLTVLATVVLRV